MTGYRGVPYPGRSVKFLPNPVAEVTLLLLPLVLACSGWLALLWPRCATTTCTTPTSAAGWRGTYATWCNWPHAACWKCVCLNCLCMTPTMQSLCM